MQYWLRIEEVDMDTGIETGQWFTTVLLNITLPPGYKNSSSPTEDTADSINDLSYYQKPTIGLTIGLGVPGTVASCIAIWASVRRYRRKRFCW